MEEKKYRLDESKIATDKVCESAPNYRSAVSEPMVSYSATDYSDDDDNWDYPLTKTEDEEEFKDEYNTDSYPMGRSLEQVRAHCESLLDKLDDPNYGRPVEELDAELDKMIAEWK